MLVLAIALPLCAVVAWVLRSELLYWAECVITSASGDGRSACTRPYINTQCRLLSRDSCHPECQYVTLGAHSSRKDAPLIVSLPTGTRGKPNQWLQGNYGPVDKEITVKDLKVEGVLPPALDGAYVRNGPNPLHKPVGGHHWCDACCAALPCRHMQSTLHLHLHWDITCTLRFSCIRSSDKE